MPRRYVSTRLADTPAPGATRSLTPSDDLQKALTEANCGDTLKLPAGAVFRGLFHFPAKHCDDAHWIIVRTSTPDSELPDESTRITPCFAGVASLPGRPQYPCQSPKKLLATIESDGSEESGPLVFTSGANHYRLIGLEITRGKPGAKLRDLVDAEDNATADHIIFDRVWMHGTAQDETKAGLHLSGMTFAAVINSYFSDFHCIAKDGACIDAQAVNGGSGNQPGGPYKIVNNFLEASGENVMFGGAAATITPADIEIRHNYLFKPMIWKEGQPGFVGSTAGRPFIVKNHFELKNGQRVLFEGNLLENCWGGFTQTGFSILLTPKNQSNRCPTCRVTDVTVRFNRVAHVASVMQISNGLSDAGGASADGQRYSIHDLVVDDIDGEKYRGFGNFAIIGSEQPQLRQVRIQHVTAFPQRALISVHVPSGAPRIANVTIVDNIFAAGDRQITSSGGGPRNCAFRPDFVGPSGVLDNCFNPISFTRNLIISGGGGWPKGNLSARDPKGAGIVFLQGKHGTEYHLCRERDDKPGCTKTSPALHAGSDGKNLGADLEAVEAEISKAN